MSQDTPRPIGSHRQLFLDDSLVAASDGVRLTQHTPYQSGEELIVMDAPWERAIHAQISAYACVRRADGMTRLWYGIEADGHRAIAYAEAADGLHFSKPSLGLHEVNGSRANNIVLPGPYAGGYVWLDPHAPPHQRYKATGKFYPGWPDAPQPAGFRMFASPDGLRWEPFPLPDIGKCDTQTILFWDDRYRRYVMYTRQWVRPPDPHHFFRQVRRLESDDLRRWDNESIVYEADAADLATHATFTGQPPVDYYGAAVWKYPDAGDLYVMLAQPFWHWQRYDPPRRLSDTGIPADVEMEVLGPSVIDARLAFSRDGKVFRRTVDRGPFLRLGPEGRFDSRLVWALPDPIPMGDELWFYYSGHNRNHDYITDPAAPGPTSAISRAALRLDGFVSADAAYHGGWLETPPLVFAGSRLELNLDSGGNGAVWVEVRDAHGQPLAGYTRADASPVWGNSVRRPVRWGQSGDVSALAGQPVRLRFWMQDCHLYAFQFKA